MLVAAILVVAGLYVLTSPPAPPFQELWSKDLDGNAYGQGVGIGDLFVTYSYTTQNQADLSGSTNEQTADLTFMLEGIQVDSGTVAWSFSFFLAGVVDSPPNYFPNLVAAGDDALLAVSWESATGTYLTVLSANASTGTPLAEWTVPAPGWSSTVASQNIATSGGTLVTWLPRTLTSPTPLLVSGFNASTGHRTWNDTVPIPLAIDGWGSGVSHAVEIGTTVEIAVAPAGSPSWLLDLDGGTGTVLGERTYNASADVSHSASGGGNFYFLATEPGGLFIDGFDASSGSNVTPVRVENVADNSTGSASLSAVDGVLIVASYSPILSYAAYDPSGGLLWISTFPNATSCGQPVYVSLGPCSTDLSPPMALGNGVVLLSSYASLMAAGDTYRDTYRAVDLADGEPVWSANYALTFGYQFWPWQSPEPAFSVESTMGNLILYAVVSPGAVALAGGTT